jgi:hypothetical protein
MMPRPPACWPKPRFANFLWRKYDYVNANAYGHTPPPYPYASARFGVWPSKFIRMYLNFSVFGPFFLYIYFYPRIIKTAVGKGLCVSHLLQLDTFTHVKIIITTIFQSVKPCSVAKNEHFRHACILYHEKDGSMFLQNVGIYPQIYFCCVHLMYRVSIKSFPDYKHLLQENYVEYKLFFFQNVTQLKKFLFQLT